MYGVLDKITSDPMFMHLYVLIPGTFVGCDGTPTDYLPWRTTPNQQPDNHRNSEDCVNIDPEGRYNDLNCQWQIVGICKKHVTSFE